MPKTAAQQEIQVAVNAFVEASRLKYGNYAHAAGYLTSTVTEMFESLTKRQQLGIIRNFQDAAQNQKKGAAE